MGSTHQQTQITRSSWLSKGIASPVNFALLLATFLLFPFIARWTDAFAFASISIHSPEHTRALVKFCLFLLVFEWAWFFIAWVGIRRYGKVTFVQLVGGSWSRPSRVFVDLGIGCGVLVVSLECARCGQIQARHHRLSWVKFLTPFDKPKSIFSRHAWATAPVSPT